jgi:hypothetical protein
MTDRQGPHQGSFGANQAGTETRSRCTLERVLPLSSYARAARRLPEREVHVVEPVPLVGAIQSIIAATDPQSGAAASTRE